MSKKRRHVVNNTPPSASVDPIEALTSEIGKLASYPSSDKVASLKTSTLAAFKDISGEASVSLTRSVTMHSDVISCEVSAENEKKTTAEVLQLPAPFRNTMRSATSAPTTGVSAIGASTTLAEAEDDPKWRAMICEAILPIAKIPEFILLLPKGASYRSILIPNMPSTIHFLVFKDSRAAMNWMWDNKLDSREFSDDLPF